MSRRRRNREPSIEEQDAAFFVWKSIQRSEILTWEEIPPNLRKFFSRDEVEPALAENRKWAATRTATVNAWLAIRKDRTRICGHKMSDKEAHKFYWLDSPDEMLDRKCPACIMVEYNGGASTIGRA